MRWDEKKRREENAGITLNRYCQSDRAMVLLQALVCRLGSPGSLISTWLALQRRISIEKAAQHRVWSSVRRLGAGWWQNWGTLLAGRIKITASDFGQSRANNRLQHLIHILGTFFAAFRFDDVLRTLAHTSYGATHLCTNKQKGD